MDPKVVVYEETLYISTGLFVPAVYNGGHQKIRRWSDMTLLET